MSLNEDKRAASNLMTNLSGFIITANLSMLAIQGASYAFVATANEQVAYCYNFLSVLAFCCFVVSTIAGGKGITKTATDLANSSWTIKTASNIFNFQAIVSFLGVILFLFASIFFTEKKNDRENIKNLLIELSSIDETLKDLTDAIKNKPNDSFNNTDTKIEILRQDIDTFKQKIIGSSSNLSCRVIDTEIDGEQLFCPDGFIFKGAEKHPSRNGTLDKIICCQ
ncbi:MAG: hypothetical protein VYB81_18780 [Pseudomonadota bacterium]|nr:hypothetical protein [Pseudomonadota bacterium]